MRSTADLESAVLSLDAEQRAHIATLLIESLSGDTAVDEAAIEALWIVEAEERARQIHAGEIELILAEDVLETLGGQRPYSCSSR